MLTVTFSPEPCDTHRRILPPVGRAIVIAVRHYAAYGSNLDPARMRAYCPHSPMVGIGWLEGWRPTFAGEDVIGWEGSVSTVVESPGDRVFVALYDIDPTTPPSSTSWRASPPARTRRLTVRVLDAGR